MNHHIHTALAEDRSAALHQAARQVRRPPMSKESSDA